MKHGIRLRNFLPPFTEKRANRNTFYNNFFQSGLDVEEISIYQITGF